MHYEIIPNPRGYVELWVDGKFAGNYDTQEEAKAEMTETPKREEDTLVRDGKRSS